LIGAKSPSDKIAANGQLDSALSRLLVIVENYPQLKSNENFMRLQDELAGTENRIAVERRRYNDTIQDYNTFTRCSPTAWWLASLVWRNDAYFKTEEGARKHPRSISITTSRHRRKARARASIAGRTSRIAHTHTADSGQRSFIVIPSEARDLLFARDQKTTMGHGNPVPYLFI